MPKKPRDFSQTKVGHLQPLYIDENSIKGNRKWVCQCDCGNIVTKSSSAIQEAIRNHRKSSCGCVTALKDLTGQKFGKLTVLKLNKDLSSNPKTDWKAYWDCLCECGNYCTVLASNLTRNHTSSCGCITYSIGERNIETILKNNKINYIKQYSFNDLYDKSLIHKLRFDFAIFDSENHLIRLIEFDGRQHHDANSFQQESFEDRSNRDKLKNKYCLENNIPLIRIPYTQRDKINLSMLLLDDTFQVKEIDNND